MIEQKANQTASLSAGSIKPVPTGLGPQARKLLGAAMALDLSQRRLLAAALRPGSYQEPEPAAPIGDRPSRLWLPADRDARIVRRAIFHGSAWRNSFRPGREIHVYILGTPGLQALAVAFGLSLAKVGTCRVGQLDTRIEQLRRDRYGSMVRCGGHFAAEPGFDGWCAPPRLQCRAAPPLGPVRLSTASLIVTLPEGITHGLFEHDLNQALRRVSLAQFADSDAGRAWCAARGADPHRLIRFSAGRSGKATPEAAREIMLFRPQADAAALAGLIETLILGYVGLCPSEARPIGASGTTPERQR